MTELILAIDPGTTQSGWALLDGMEMCSSGVMSNEDMLAHLVKAPNNGQRLAIEMIASYGMAVGKEVFETCVWIGRFKQAWFDPNDVWLIYRREVKLHLCGTTQAKDANVTQAIKDLFPATGGGACPQKGTKSKPGPLYGVSSHAWSALAVAITAQHVIDKARPVLARVADPLSL